MPAWLNDVTLYHNRGDTTFVGEDSQYGDFFGLDDLFTEHPTVVNGMIDVYKTWIRDFGVDGFRIDTMKHVNDEFWQKFGPEILRLRAPAGQARLLHVRRGLRRRRSRQLHLALHTHDKMQAVLDFPFQDAARELRLQGQARRTSLRRRSSRTTTGTPTRTRTSISCRRSSAITTWAASATSSQTDNPGAGDAELLARDRLAHELMYFSRGNPVVYYGDEQGFTGPGGDQVRPADDVRRARCRTTWTTTCSAPTRPTRRPTSTRPPALPGDQRAGRADRARTRRCATARSRSGYVVRRPGIYAFSRIDRTSSASTSSR